MKANVEIAIPEFNSLGSKEVKFTQKESVEETFNSILKTLNKSDSKNWQSIEFDFDNDTILVCKHWLIETDFNFSLSHQIQVN